MAGMGDDEAAVHLEELRRAKEEQKVKEAKEGVPLAEKEVAEIRNVMADAFVGLAPVAAAPAAAALAAAAPAADAAALAASNSEDAAASFADGSATSADGPSTELTEAQLISVSLLVAAAREATSQSSNGVSPDEILPLARRAAKAAQLEIDALAREEACATKSGIALARARRTSFEMGAITGSENVDTHVDALDAEEFEAVALVRHVVTLVCQSNQRGLEERGSSRIPSNAAEVEAIAVKSAIERMQYALREKLSVHEAVAVAVSRSIDGVAAASTAVQRVIKEHGSSLTLLASAAASHAADAVNASGSTANVAVLAGERAARKVLAKAAGLEDIHSEAEILAQTVRDRLKTSMAEVEVPGWTLRGWLSSLKLDTIVCQAVRKRFDEHISEQHGEIDEAMLRRYEQGFIEHLGSCDVETVMLLLKESPVLHDLATVIHAACAEICALKVEEEAQEVQVVDPAEEVVDIEQLNSEFIKQAGVLAFSPDASVFWNSMTRLVGPPNTSIDLVKAMEAEHTQYEDADTPFIARNYGTVTTSRLEWGFVATPYALGTMGAYLRELGHPTDRWPAGPSARDGGGHSDPGRKPLSYKEYMSSAVGRRLTVELEAEGEQAMSEPEFIAMRAYTGPLFEKYNTILRAANAAFFMSYLKQLGIDGNRYTTTNHVLCAAICKLSKLTTVETVYRAPGRAMPDSFWQHAKMGLAGIIETGCLSTSSDKEVAMQYARRSSAKLLFEVRLGFVARGADIGRWSLSQYPMEAEILMPPCTALQLVETTVDKDTLIVCFQPTITRPEVHSGTDDIVLWHLRQAEEMKRREAEAAVALEALNEERKKRDADEAAYEWRLSMAEMRAKGAQTQIAHLQTSLCDLKRKQVAEKLKHATTHDALGLKKEDAELEKQAAKAAEAEAAKKAVANAAIEVEQIASRQLQWALLSMNPRYARTVQQEIVQQDVVQQEIKRDDASPQTVQEEKNQLQKETSPGEDSLPGVLTTLEEIMTKMTDPGLRKKVSDIELAGCFAVVVACMQSSPKSLLVQNLGCCALACLFAEVTAAEEAAAEVAAVEQREQSLRLGVLHTDAAATTSDGISAAPHGDETSAPNVPQRGKSINDGSNAAPPDGKASERRASITHTSAAAKANSPEAAAAITIQSHQRGRQARKATAAAAAQTSKQLTALAEPAPAPEGGHPTIERATLLRKAALDSDLTCAIRDAFKVLPKSMQLAGQQVLSILHGPAASEAKNKPSLKANAKPKKKKDDAKKQDSRKTLGDQEKEGEFEGTGLEWFKHISAEALREQLHKQNLKTIDFFRKAVGTHNRINLLAFLPLHALPFPSRAALKSSFAIDLLHPGWRPFHIDHQEGVWPSGARSGL